MMVAGLVPVSTPAPARTSVVFSVPGHLPGWQRTGHDRRSGNIYTPSQTRSAEALVRWYALKAMRGRFLLRGPVRLVVSIHKTIPKGWPKKKQAAAKFVTGKPDLDNVLKLVADSCNGTVWHDDSQIAQAMITRRYTHALASVDIIIKPLSDEDDEV